MAQSKIHDVFEKNFQISFVPILGTIIIMIPPHDDGKEADVVEQNQPAS